MGWFKQLMGLEAPKANTASQWTAGNTQPVTGPLGLAPGKGVMFDASLKLLLDEKTTVVIPGSQEIWANGTVDLGQSTWLSRYYMNADTEVIEQDHRLDLPGDLAGGVHLQPVIFVVHVIARQPGRLAGPQSLIGLPTYTHNGVEYARVWGSEAGQTELVAMTEQVVNPEDAYSVEHRSMLYARDTGLTDRREFPAWEFSFFKA